MEMKLKGSNQVSYNSEVELPRRKILLKII